MQRRLKASLVTATAAAAALLLGSLAGCPGAPSKPGIPGRPGGTGMVDPNTCGNYAVSDAGRKLKAFFEATVALDKAVKDTESYVRDSCAMMGKELAMPEADLGGNTKDTCSKVIAELKNHLQVGIKAESKLNIDYQPAVCEVNVDVAAKAAAQCEAKASADVAVKCEGQCGGTCTGQCSGTCQGKCDGTCAGSTGEGGECNGQCQGTCEGSCSANCSGSCSGGCEGHAEVDASAECKADAEVRANIDAKCTEPKLDVTYEQDVVVDETKVKEAVAAIKAGLPRLLMVKAKLEGPVKAAFVTWQQSAKDLYDAKGTLMKSFGEQGMCVAGQIGAAFGMIAGIQASIDVQVEVSVDASASAGVGG